MLPPTRYALPPTRRLPPTHQLPATAGELGASARDLLAPLACDRPAYPPDVVSERQGPPLAFHPTRTYSRAVPAIYLGAGAPQQLQPARAFRCYTQRIRARHASLGLGIAQADCVVPPERFRIDKRPSHPRFVRRKLDRLKGLVRDPQRRLAKAQLAARHEAEAGVVPRIPLQENNRSRPLTDDLKPAPNQSRTDPAPVNLRQHSQRTKDLHVHQPPRAIQQTTREHDVPDHLPAVLGNQRQTAASRDNAPQRINQLSNNKAMITKRPQMNISHSPPVARHLFPKIHPWML